MTREKKLCKLPASFPVLWQNHFRGLRHAKLCRFMRESYPLFRSFYIKFFVRVPNLCLISSEKLKANSKTILLFANSRQILFVSKPFFYFLVNQMAINLKERQV